MSSPGGIRDLSGINLGAPVSASTHDDPSSSSPELTKFPDLPAAPPSKVVGSGYSSYHPVPTVSGYKEEQKEHEKAADEYARIVEIRAKEQAEHTARASATAPEGVAGKQGGTDASGTLHDDGNKATAQKKTRDEDPTSGKPVTEKQRMMDQMNAHKGESMRSASRE